MAPHTSYRKDTAVVLTETIVERTDPEEVSAETVVDLTTHLFVTPTLTEDTVLNVDESEPQPTSASQVLRPSNVHERDSIKVYWEES